MQSGITRFGFENVSGQDLRPQCYLGRSEIYQLPYGRDFTREDGTLGLGQLANCEQVRAYITDFQIRGGSLAFGDGVVTEGDFSKEESVSNDTVNVQLNSLQAIVGGVFVDRALDNPVAWNNLPLGEKVFMYVALVEGDRNQTPFVSSSVFGDLQEVSNTTGVAPEDSILVATRASGIDVPITTVPSGKQFVTLLNHRQKRSAHGNVLSQEQITTSGIDILSGITVQNAIVSGLAFGDSASFDVPSPLEFSEGILQNDLRAFSGSEYRDFVIIKGTVSGGSVELGLVELNYPESNISGIPFLQELGSGGAPVTDPVGGEALLFGDLIQSGSILFKGKEGAKTFSGQELLPAGSIAGTDIESLGGKTHEHVSGTEVFDNNPHRITAFELSGVELLGASNPLLREKFPEANADERLNRMRGNVEMASGTTIDDLDASELKQLIDGRILSGTVVPHEHLLLPDHLFVFAAPFHKNMVMSGDEAGLLTADRFGDRNWLSWFRSAGEATTIGFLQMKVPIGATGLREFKFLSRSTGPGGVHRRVGIKALLCDTDGEPTMTPNHEFHPSRHGEEIVFSGASLGGSIAGNWAEGEFFEAAFVMRSASGIGIHLGGVVADFIP